MSLLTNCFKSFFGPPSETPGGGQKMGKSSSSGTLSKESSFLFKEPPAPQPPAPQSQLDVLRSSWPAIKAATRERPHPDPIGFLRETKGLLSSHTLGMFDRLLNIRTVTHPKPAPGVAYRNTYVLGPAEGSVGRVILIALQSGHMKLGEMALHELADILNKEGLIRTIPDEVKRRHYYHKFQKSTEIANIIERIVDGAWYFESPMKLVFLGGILHEKWSCNKKSEIKLVEKLHSHGAVFVRGKGDVSNRWISNRAGITRYDLFSCEDPWRWRYQQTEVMEEALAEWSKFEKQYFVNSYYDSEKNIFYIDPCPSYGVASKEFYVHPFKCAILYLHIYKVSSLKDLSDCFNKEDLNDGDRDTIKLFMEEGDADLFVDDADQPISDLGPLFQDVLLVHGRTRDGFLQESPDRFQRLGMTPRIQGGVDVSKNTYIEEHIATAVLI
jgi:hypothetical protein